MKLTLYNRFTGKVVKSDRLKAFDVRIWDILTPIKRSGYKALLINDFVSARKYYEAVKSIMPLAIQPRPKAKKMRGKK